MKKKFFRMQAEDENGAVMVIVALGLVAFLSIVSFAVDLGLQYYQKSRLQNALDASVLSAVYKLPATSTTDSLVIANAKTQAIADVKEYMSKNGYSDYTDDVAVTFLDVNGSDIAAGDTTTVPVEIRATLNDVKTKTVFANIFGVEVMKSSGKAAAKMVNRNMSIDFPYNIYADDHSRWLGLNGHYWYVDGNVHTNAGFYSSPNSNGGLTVTGGVEALDGAVLYTKAYVSNGTMAQNYGAKVGLLNATSNNDVDLSSYKLGDTIMTVCPTWPNNFNSKIAISDGLFSSYTKPVLSFASTDAYMYWLYNYAYPSHTFTDPYSGTSSTMSSAYWLNIYPDPQQAVTFTSGITIGATKSRFSKNVYVNGYLTFNWCTSYSTTPAGSDGFQTNTSACANYFGGDLVVNGSTTFSGGDTYIAGNLYVNGNLNVNGNSKLKVNGNVVVNGQIKVEGGTGALIVENGDLKANSLYILPTLGLNVKTGSVYIQGTGIATSENAVYVGGSSGLYIGGNFYCADSVYLGTCMTSTGHTIKGNIFIGGNLKSEAYTKLYGDMYVKGDFVPSGADPAVELYGGVIYVGGDLTTQQGIYINGVLIANGDITIKGMPSSFNTDSTQTCSIYSVNGDIVYYGSSGDVADKYIKYDSATGSTVVSGDITQSTTTQVHGYMYAPNGNIDLQSSILIFGSVIGKTLSLSSASAYNDSAFSSYALAPNTVYVGQLDRALPFGSSQELAALVE